MRVEARLWHRLLASLAALAVAVSVASGPARAGFYPGSVYSNITAFSACVGYSSSISADLRDLTQNGFVGLGYASTAFGGKGFTKSNVLARAPYDIAFYVHSHGDFYGSGDIQGFREDGGDCTQSVVLATEIRKARTTPEGNLTGAKLVIASTCHLAEAPRNGYPAMSEAFSIERLKSDPSGAGYRGPEFFLGYRGLAWTDDMLRYESAFWRYVDGKVGLGDAYRLAVGSTTMRHGTTPDWFGSYTYTGQAQPSSPCTTCALRSGR